MNGRGQSTDRPRSRTALLLGVTAAGVVAVIGLTANLAGSANPQPRSERAYAEQLLDRATAASRSLVADGNIDEAEYRGALEAYRTCVEAAGYRAIDSVTPSGMPSIATEGVGAVVGDPVAEAAKERCHDDWRLVASVAYASAHPEPVSRGARDRARRCLDSTSPGSEEARICMSNARAQSAVPGLLEAIERRGG